MTAQLRRTEWVQIDGTKESAPALVVPEALAKLMADHHPASHHATVTVGMLGSGRYQIDQRTPEGVLLRRIVTDVSAGDPLRATLSGYQVLMTKVGEDWQPESPQQALDAMAREVTTAAPAA